MTKSNVTINSKKATMLNINQGHNLEIMSKCQALFQYSDFNAKVREYKQSMSIEDAVDKQ